MSIESQSVLSDESKQHKKVNILLWLTGLVMGLLNGAIAGALFGFILSTIYHWHPYYTAVKGSIACSMFGVPVGFVGSIASGFAEKKIIKITIYAGCGILFATLFFISYSETSTEFYRSFLGGFPMGSILGVMIGVCMLGIERVVNKER